MAAKHQFWDIQIPRILDKRARAVLADEIIEHIYDRTTQRNIDRNGKRFPKYSKEYKESLDFRIAGKSPSKVDLELSGDMLAELQVLRSKPGQLRIGYKRGSEENGKADGNIRGTYGTATPDPKKARDFLGLPRGLTDRLINKTVRKASNKPDEIARLASILFGTGAEEAT